MNAHGTPRYKCLACLKVFAHGGKADKRQRETHKNRDIFLNLVNTVPIHRVIKILDLSTSVLYTRLDFIHRQCAAFVGERERTLVERMPVMALRPTLECPRQACSFTSRS